LYSGSSSGDLFIYDLNKELTQQNTQSEFVKPTYKIKCSKAAVTGLSLHPCEQFIAISTGQRLFPSNLLLNQLSTDNSSPDETKTDEEINKEYISLGKGSTFDNSIKLYKPEMN
jgi:hypothetical protein